MKTLLVALAGWASATASFAQTGAGGVLGQYEQQYFLAPDNVKAAGGAVVISQDPKLPKVVWVANLLPGGRVKAILQTRSNGTAMYAIPAQTVGGYQIRTGCAMYDPDDAKVMISLNNKINCFGSSQSDYDAGVAVSKTGRVSAGGVEIDGRGGVKTPGAQVGRGGVRVDSKAVMAGVQYTGHKQGAKADTSDDD